MYKMPREICGRKRNKFFKKEKEKMGRYQSPIFLLTTKSGSNSISSAPPNLDCRPGLDPDWF
jgi:hypothetical protein